jgi:hypothetical protein
MNAIITLQTRLGPDGSEYTPPAFANVFQLGQKAEGEGSSSYFIPTAQHMGRLTRVELYERAEKLWEQFEAGKVKVAEVAPSEQV